MEDPHLTVPLDDPLEQCFSCYADRLRFLLLRISRSAEVAEDISQDVWLKVAQIQRGENTYAQDLTNFATPAAQWNYLSRMGLNRYRDWLRQQRTLSIEDLANRIFPDATEHQTGAEVVEHLTAKGSRYEHLRRLQESMDTILDAFMDDTSPAHQMIVFGFNRPLQWEPSEIVQRQTHQTLLVLSRQLCDELAEAFIRAADRSHALCQRLEERLSRAVAWEHVRAPRAANTELDIYFKKKDLNGKAREVAQWSLSVQRRIVKRLLAVRGVAVRNKD